MVMVQDISLDLCVISAPTKHLTTLGVDGDENAEQWDYLIVDAQKKVIMMSGQRFAKFCAHECTESHVDSCKGRALKEVFPKSVTDILEPLLDATMRGESPQLHTIFQSQNLTLFAYPMNNETGDVIGATIVYRPTKYNQADIASLISTRAP